MGLSRGRTRIVMSKNMKKGVVVFTLVFVCLLFVYWFWYFGVRFSQFCVLQWGFSWFVGAGDVLCLNIQSRPNLTRMNIRRRSSWKDCWEGIVLTNYGLFDKRTWLIAEYFILLYFFFVSCISVQKECFVFEFFCCILVFKMRKLCAPNQSKSWHIIKRSTRLKLSSFPIMLQCYIVV